MLSFALTAVLVPLMGSAGASALLMEPLLAEADIDLDLSVDRSMANGSGIPAYETAWINQTLDHFSYDAEAATFKERVLYNIDYFKERWCPGGDSAAHRHSNWPPTIILYTGNEGNIETFWNNSGFAFDLAKRHGAAVVFPEHRYYGKTGPECKDPKTQGECYRFLTTEQAIADYAALAVGFRGVLLDPDFCSDTRNSELVQRLDTRSTKHYPLDSPQDIRVMAVGGSYGGMLTTYFRYRYPNIVQAALAASAPIAPDHEDVLDRVMTEHWTTPFGTSIDQAPAQDFHFNSIITESFHRHGDCDEPIRRALSVLNDLGSTDDNPSPQVAQAIQTAFHLCDPLKTNTDIDAVVAWVIDAIGYTAMVNYDTPTNFLAPLPADPVSVMCKGVNGALDSLALNLDTGPTSGKKQNDSQPGSSPNTMTPAEASSVLYPIMDVYRNTTGTTECFKLTTADPNQNFGLNQWDYQTCTQYPFPIASNGKTDFLPPQSFDIPSFIEDCKDQFSVTPRWGWIALAYGAMRPDSAGRIIYSNGEMDPWSAYGVIGDPDRPIRPDLCTIHLGFGSEWEDLVNMATVKASLNLGVCNNLAVYIYDHAHHADLRTPQPKVDRPQLVRARDMEEYALGLWLKKSLGDEFNM
eukprot:Clim_evm5s78 gene=Clim_evmTU5s78